MQFASAWQCSPIFKHSFMSLQCVPLPAYPELQVQFLLPTMLVHVALSWQPPWFVRHSSISKTSVLRWLHSIFSMKKGYRHVHSCSIFTKCYVSFALSRQNQTQFDAISQYRYILLSLSLQNVFLISTTERIACIDVTKWVS